MGRRGAGRRSEGCLDSGGESDDGYEAQETFYTKMYVVAFSQMRDFSPSLRY